MAWNALESPAHGTPRTAQGWEVNSKGESLKSNISTIYLLNQNKGCCRPAIRQTHHPRTLALKMPCLGLVRFWLQGCLTVGCRKAQRRALGFRAGLWRFAR